jgi:CelD/BcsL family acetyltransferase involved in cellulose biosynthesis
MTVYELDPTRDARWDALLQRHPEASIFHTREWLEALRQTYGYEPVAFTSSPPGCPLTNGFPFCRISHWLSGRRLVSLPFSDHCTPLVESSEQLICLLTCLQQKLEREKWSYIEIRPTNLISAGGAAFQKSNVFVLHKLDTRPSLDEIFQNFHRDCVQRKIQRAAREGLTYEEGGSDLLVTKFYHLLLLTRRRHGLPAQPIQWFQNLVACLGDKVKIRVASKDGRPVASVVTLRYRHRLVYKYGCSNQHFNNLGGMQLLLWHAIQEAKNDHLSEFDMGRSDCENVGLVAFKDRWGAARTQLTYLRYPRRYIRSAAGSRRTEIRKYVWSHVPSSVLAVVGGVLYKHMG